MSSLTHGLSQTDEYHSWESMKGRCSNKNNAKYKIYGGRGISVCKRWANSFEYFLKDMGKRPSANHSVDRINNELGYSPDNCKWSDRIEQANNKRNNVFLECDGKKKTKSQWAREKGMTPGALAARLRMGWSVSKAINTPLAKHVRSA